MTTEKDVKIHVKGLKKSFGHVHVLKGIDAEIKAGEVICVIGPSGSGKSTFLRCLNRLEEATAGEILVDGQSITEKNSNIDKIRQHIGMVFQQFNLFPHYTVKENIMLAPVELKLKSKEEAEKKALELLSKTEQIHRTVKNLQSLKSVQNFACDVLSIYDHIPLYCFV